MAQDNTTADFDTLKKSIEDNSRRKIRLEERLNNATDNMKKIVSEVREAGYDPKTLESVRADKARELEAAMVDLRAKVQAQTQEITAIETSL